jgi:Tfp pilus assembly protein PilF
VLTWLTLLLAVTTKKDGYRLLFYLMSFIFCLLGTLSKEVMVVVPAFIIWYDRLFFSSSWVELFKKRWGYYLGLSGCWIVLGGLINSQAELYPEYNRQMPSRFEYLMTQAEVITHYLKLVFDPRVLCFDYGWPIVHDFFQVWPQFCFIVGLFIGAICLMLKYPIIGLIAGSFFLFLGPTSSINPVLAPAYEYRMYLALLPIILLNMLVCYYVIGKIFTSSRTQQMAFMLLTSIFALPLCYLSHERCQLYTNFEVLWMDTLNKAPNYFLPYYMLGHHYDEEGDPEKALPYCQKAVELAPRDPDSKNNYGLCLLELNRIEEAQRVLLENLQLNPSHIDTLNNLGTAYGMQNDLQSAERCFMQILKLKNEHIGAKINLARLSLLKGDYTAADTFLQQIIRSEPVNFQAIVMQTELYLLQKKFRQAKQIIDYLIQNYSDHPDTKRLSSQLP